MKIGFHWIGIAGVGAVLKLLGREAGRVCDEAGARVQPWPAQLHERPALRGRREAVDHEEAWRRGRRCHF